MTDAEALVAHAQQLGIGPEVFLDRLKGKHARWAFSERARLYWSLRDTGWNNARIARAAGYRPDSVRALMLSHERPEPMTFERPKAAADRITKEVASRDELDEGDIWKRNTQGRLFQNRKSIDARHEIWLRMLADGYSLKETAIATTGHDNHSAIVKVMKQAAA